MEAHEKKLTEATNVIDAAKSRSNVIRRKPRDVEELPQAQAIALLGAAEDFPEEAPEAPAEGAGGTG